MAKKTAYQKLLLNPLWQRKRVEILQRDDFTCVLCSDARSTLHVHHDNYLGNPWNVPSDQIRTLCEHCHCVVHALPELYVTKVHKQQSFTAKCWEIVAYFDTGYTFLYMFFSADDSKPDIIKVLPNPINNAA